MSTIVDRVVSEEDSNGGDVPGNSPEVEAWLKVYRSEKHRMSASPPAQQIRSAELGPKKALDESHYQEVLKRCNINIASLSSSRFCLTDIIFNYAHPSKPASLPSQGSLYARTHELVIGDCRISMQKPPGTLTGPQFAESKYMETYAWVGIPVAVIVAIKMNIRAASTTLSSADIPGVEEINNGLQWIPIGFAREGVRFSRVSLQRKTLVPITNVADSSKCEEACILFFHVGVLKDEVKNNSYIHFQLFECHLLEE